MRWESGFFRTDPQPWQTWESFVARVGNSITPPPALAALRRMTERKVPGARTPTDRPYRRCSAR